MIGKDDSGRLIGYDSYLRGCSRRQIIPLPEEEISRTYSDFWSIQSVIQRLIPDAKESTDRKEPERRDLARKQRQLHLLKRRIRIIELALKAGQMPDDDDGIEGLGVLAPKEPGPITRSGVTWREYPRDSDEETAA